jgi:hypothetical protein
MCLRPRWPSFKSVWIKSVLSVWKSERRGERKSDVTNIWPRRKKRSGRRLKRFAVKRRSVKESSKKRL